MSRYLDSSSVKSSPFINNRQLGRARFTGFLATRLGVEDKGGWQSALFGTEAQAHDTAHWRGPPAGGICIPTEGLGPMKRDPDKDEA